MKFTASNDNLKRGGAICALIFWFLQIREADLFPELLGFIGPCRPLEVHPGLLGLSPAGPVLLSRDPATKSRVNYLVNHA